jgi:hypothetical protein
LTLKKVQKIFGTGVRFDWLDQFRGLAMLLFIIQTVAAYLLNSTGFPVIAPHFNHGLSYAEILNWPPLITIIDVGKHIFIFLVGFMAAFSVNKRLNKGIKSEIIWLRIIRRLIAILAINAIALLQVEIKLIRDFLIDTTLGYIAWVGFIVSVITFFIRKADYRFFIGIIPFVTQFILDLFLDLDRIWMNLMGLVGIGLVASAFTSWMIKEDNTVEESNFKKRILPISVGSFLVMFLVEFIQWADQELSTVAICAMGIGISGLALFLFYQMEKSQFKVPILSPLGKNLLIVIILVWVLIQTMYLDLFLIEFIQANLLYPFYHLIYAGIVPIVIIWGIAKVLDELKLFLRV